MFNFQSKHANFAVWVGNKKLKFKRGLFHTEDKAIADFLRKHDSCTEIKIEMPTAKPSVVVELKDKPKKADKSK